MGPRAGYDFATGGGGSFGEAPFTGVRVGRRGTGRAEEAVAVDAWRGGDGVAEFVRRDRPMRPRLKPAISCHKSGPRTAIAGPFCQGVPFRARHEVPLVHGGAALAQNLKRAEPSPPRIGERD